MVSIIEKNVEGIDVIMTEFGYKSFSMVVKSLGHFTKRTSPTYFRTSGVMETWYGQAKVHPSHPKESADRIMDLYRNNDISPNTLVISPGLELACYIARALNAAVIPSQLIANAPDREYVEKNMSPDTRYIIGHEMDWPELCVWTKPYRLGELYAEIIENADDIVILSADSGPDNHLGTCRGWRKHLIDVLDGFTGDDNFRHRIQDPKANGYESFHDKIPHWEFSMEMDQILNLEDYCKERGKRTTMISTGDWSGLIAAKLFAKLYEKNGIRPEGITFHDYWACHPFYESEFARIPVTNFQYGADEYVDAFRKELESMDWKNKDGEYLVWPEELNHTKAINPAERFESWGFPTVYRTDRPYDVWCFAWEQEEDPKNPTREYIIPRLKEKDSYWEFPQPVSVDELIGIAGSVRKTDVTVHENRIR